MNGTIHTMTSRIAAIVLTVVLVAASGLAQDIEHVKPPIPPESLPDSTHKARPDSVIHFDMRRWAGSLALTADTAGTITATAMEWQTPVSLSDVLANVPGVFVADPSSIGQYYRPYTHGIDWRGTAVMLDGIPMNDPTSGALNLSMIPAGMADRIEAVIGTRSFMYGTGATGAAINIIRPRVSRVKPVTRIRYEESDYSYATSDGKFVQDISERVNVQAGYQYQGTTGRFDNSGHEQWSIRSDVRYHPAKDWDLTAHYLYTQTQTGLNEGIDLTQTGTALAFSTQQAIVRNPDAYEKLTRHDLAVQLSGSFTDDSTAHTSVSAYRSQWLREYRDEENRSTPNGIFLAQDHKIARTGLQVRQRFELGPQTITAGLFLDDQRVLASDAMGSIATTVLAASLMDEIALGEKSAWAVYGRVDNTLGNLYGGAGTDLQLAAGNVLRFTLGASFMARPPDFTELYWTGNVTSSGLLDDKEQHTLLQAGIGLMLGNTGSVALTYSYRTVKNRGLILLRSNFYQPGTESDSVRPALNIIPYTGNSMLHSLDLALDLHFAWFTIEGTAGIDHWEQNASVYAYNEIPNGYARGGLYYRNRILNDELELQVGVRGQVRGRMYGGTVLGEHLLPMLNTKTELGAASTVDLVLIGHIGDAYIHVLWENVTDVKYFTTPFTPALGRRFRFGVSWEFLN
jgi:outer membrane receptor protein involved in Fe transport